MTDEPKCVPEFSSGDDLQAAFPTLKIGQEVIYRGVRHKVIDAGAQGKRVAAIADKPKVVRYKTIREQFTEEDEKTLALLDDIESDYARLAARTEMLEAGIDGCEKDRNEFERCADQAEAEQMRLEAENKRLRELESKFGDFLIALSNTLPKGWESNDSELKKLYLEIWQLSGGER